MSAICLRKDDIRFAATRAMPAARARFIAMSLLLLLTPKPPPPTSRHDTRRRRAVTAAGVLRHARLHAARHADGGDTCARAMRAAPLERVFACSLSFDCRLFN